MLGNRRGGSSAVLFFVDLALPGSIVEVDEGWFVDEHAKSHVPHGTRHRPIEGRRVLGAREAFLRPCERHSFEDPTDGLGLDDLTLPSFDVHEVADQVVVVWVSFEVLRVVEPVVWPEEGTVAEPRVFECGPRAQVVHDVLVDDDVVFQAQDVLTVACFGGDDHLLPEAVPSALEVSVVFRENTFLVVRENDVLLPYVGAFDTCDSSGVVATCGSLQPDQTIHVGIPWSKRSAERPCVFGRGGRDHRILPRCKISVWRASSCRKGRPRESFRRRGEWLHVGKNPIPVSL